MFAKGVTCVAVFAAALIAVGCGSSGDGSSVTVAPATTGDSSGPASTTVTAPPTTEATNTVPATAASATTAAVTTTAAPKDLTIESGFSVGERQATAGAKVTNPTTDQAACGVQVVFTLKGPDGTPIDTQTEHISWIPAGESRLSAPLQIGYQAPAQAASMEVTTVVDSYGPAASVEACNTFSFDTGVPLQVANPTIVRDQFFDRVTGQVTNQTTTLSKFASLVCLERAAGTIVGGISTSITDPIAPGQSIAFEAGAIEHIPQATDTVECEVIGSAA